MDHDCELLELAARAVGIKAQYSENFGDFSIGEPYSRDEERWNPLTRDEDAFRLSVTLEISTDFAGSSACAISRDQKVVMIETKDGDLLAATRRAIVRAAAEIGRS